MKPDQLGAGPAHHGSRKRLATEEARRAAVLVGAHVVQICVRGETLDAHLAYLIRGTTDGADSATMFKHVQAFAHDLRAVSDICHSPEAALLYPNR